MAYKQGSPIWLKSMLVLILVAILYIEINDKTFFKDSWLYLVLLLTYSIFVFVRHLEVQLSNDGIRYRLYPFQKKYTFIPDGQVKSVSIQKISPLFLFGGWGMRSFFGSSNSRIVSLKGNTCLKICTLNNEEIFLGIDNKVDKNQMQNFISNLTSSDSPPA